MFRTLSVSAMVIAGLAFASSAAWAGPKVVSGPGANPACFKPWNDKTKYLQWDKKAGPYRVAIVNGFVGNTWRIQMIKTAKAYAEQAGVKEKIKEFKVISTGTDVAAQLGAMEDFINQGYDAIVTIAVSPEGFDRVIRLADKNNVVVVPFDNVLDTDKVMMVNEDQLEMGKMYGRWLREQLGAKKTGKILEVRGLPGNSVDRDRHVGFQEVMKKDANFEIIEVVGNWDDGTAQKVTADAIAAHGKFEGIIVQGGSTGVVRAMIDGKHPWVPIAGESENGFRKLLAQHGKDGLKGISIGQSPGLVAIAMKAALSALEGNPMPQLISVPIPASTYAELKDGVNYWSNLTDNFFTVNEFKPCDTNITATEIMAKDEKNTN
ncbi:sugar ABC transporter substrate-binding protein [Prosthecomicrobium hirschii]|uniref:Ribose ABC transporter substrate-binding protein n=1 Tax=Prosthecodimorpha hirschii TaxID=665126 RepID=A0A0P6W1A0_9HYPH|nr:sugar ABC transporter substrate-binding protein [Prosthecomicrobium hirschii]KPL51926.1 ribose ABC transporter substrate-binding protein [Prosthecomicrobium hirschii]MCW1843724.1 sugar ABC transporter substrate-binding protein [Prosthecomicrobium hirschii]TPQ51808.1 ribose ABC transporter substrate-binding protein [Prosthecomicrobium hirschii]